MSIEIARADVAEILELRHRVLRPGFPIEASHYPEDPIAMHFAARVDGVAVGCATFFPEGYLDVTDAWRLRGMAVDPAHQGSGIGRKVLDAGVTAAREAAVPLIWANARTTALGFYRNAGWEAVGDEFVQPPLGIAHFVIVLRL